MTLIYRKNNTLLDCPPQNQLDLKVSTTFALTDLFEEMYSTVFPQVFLNLIPIDIKDALTYPVIYPQIIKKNDLYKIQSIIELEDDEDFIQSIFLSDPQAFAGDPSIDRIREEKRQLGDLSEKGIWKKNDEALLSLEKEQNYLKSLLEAVTDTNIPAKFREKGIVIAHQEIPDENRIDVYIVTEDWLKFRLTKIEQMSSVTSYLLKELHLFNITITPFIYFKEYGVAEMFIEIEGIFILVKIMSNSVGAKLRWREDRQEVFIYRKTGKKAWNSATDAIQKDFKSQEILIRDYTNLMGTSSRQRRKPMLKVLLLEGSTIDLGNNPEHLYDDVPGHKYLKIKANSNVFVFELEGLATFLATAVVRQNFKRDPQTGVLLPTGDCSPEEHDRRLIQVLDTLRKV